MSHGYRWCCLALLGASCSRPPKDAPPATPAPAPVLEVAEPEAEAESAVEAPEASAFAGALDESFGKGGFALVTNAPGEHRFSGLVALDDDSVAVVGYAQFAGSYDFAAAMLTPGGELDERFGTRGFLRIGKHRGFGEGIAVDGRGRLVVAGYFYAHGGVDTLVARFDRSGKLDSSFGKGGVSVLDFGDDDRPSRLWVRADGTIIVAGHHSRRKNAVFALRPDGSLDRRFGIGGVSVVDMGPGGGSAFLTRAAPAPDGGVVAGGYLFPESQGFVFRLDDNGARDARFGRNGVVLLERPQLGSAWAVGVDGRGRVLFSGATTVGPAALFRLLPDGSRDRSFGKDGLALSARDGKDQLYDLLPRAGGSIVGVGFRGLAEDASGIIWQLSDRGSALPGFGRDGVVTRTLGGGTFLFDADWDKKGRLVVCGNVLVGDRSPGLVARFR